MSAIRSILAITLIVTTFGSMAQVNWVSIEKAQELTKKEPRKIMIDVYTKWCGPCRMMDRMTFNDKQTAKYINDNFYAVKFNAEGPDSVVFRGTTFKNPGYVKDKPGRNGTHEFTKIAAKNGRIGYPTIVFIDEELSLITAVPGAQKPAQFEPLLAFIKEEVYADTTTTWTKYQANFKSKRVVAFPSQ